jgi:photosystem II stability/assembly factor-like uncharacterized protein
MTAMKAMMVACLLVASCAAEWKPVTVPAKAGFRGLSAASAGVVWITGTQGTVLRTTDGGTTWSLLPVAGAEKLDFRGVRAFDDRNAILMSSGKAEDGAARIYRTTDGGAHWQLVLEGKNAGVFFDAIAFWDRRHGIVLSDPVNGRFVLFTTADGGATWQRVPPERLPAALENEGAFAASNSCLVVGSQRRVWFATGGANTARVFRSSDRGTTWSVSETPMHPANASSGIFSLAFRDAQSGIAVGGDYANPGNSPTPNILLTSDGGKTWHDGGASDPAGLFFSAAAYAPETNEVWIAGSRGLNVWRNGAWHKEAAGNFNAITFVDSHHGWAVGPDGLVMRWGR